MILWICNPQNGGCGYIGLSSEWETEELLDSTDFPVSSVSYCPYCMEDYATTYKAPKEEKVLTKKTARSVEKAMWKEEVVIPYSMTEKALAVTVHQRGQYSLCNTWARKKDGYEKVLPEKILDQNPDPEMLLGEVYRLLSDPLKRASIDANMNLKLKVMELIFNCRTTVNYLRQKKGKALVV